LSSLIEGIQRKLSFLPKKRVPQPDLIPFSRRA
jgi:hypothetical protein